MTLASTTAEVPVADRRERPAAVVRARRGRERRKGQGRINRVAPRSSRLQGIGAICSAISLGIACLLFLGTTLLQLPTHWLGVAVLATMLGVSVLALIMGSIEQRLIEIRLELMMLNGGQRSADRQGRAEDRRA